MKLLLFLHQIFRVARIAVLIRYIRTLGSWSRTSNIIQKRVASSANRSDHGVRISRLETTLATARRANFVQVAAS